MNLRSFKKELYFKYKKEAVSFILLIFCIGFSFIISWFGLSSAVLILLGIIGIPATYAIISFPKIGVVALLVASYLMVIVARMGVTFPLGTILDGLQLLLLIGFLFLQKSKPCWHIYKSNVSVILIIWLAYNLLEVANPFAESRLAWLYTIRTVGIVTLTYFVFFRVIDTVLFIRRLLKLWIFLSFLAAVYAIKQEYFGFTELEQAWLNSNPRLIELYFINGHWRKFSFFTDPVTFAYNMVISSILCFSLVNGPYKKSKKMVLGLLGLLFFVVMLYSGTRGAYVLIPAAFILYSILKFNKRILFLAAIVSALFGFLVLFPSSNPNIIRFQRAFQPSDDPSFNVRKINQKKIQPYIISHPIGGGLGATGTWGQRFAPNSYLANFPPDSGYVRVAVEQGWIGLLIFCIFIFIVLKTGIENYFAIKDTELKTYCLAMTLIIFALNIGNYPQEALVQYPTNVYFYLVIALIQATLRLDQLKQKL